MATAGYGDYVLVSSFGPEKPPWPAVVVMESDLPTHLRQMRPQIRNKPVLLMSQLKLYVACASSNLHVHD